MCFNSYVILSDQTMTYAANDKIIIRGNYEEKIFQFINEVTKIK